MTRTASIGTELSAQAESLRRLARDLLGDPHLADDAVQDAMQAAIAHPPRTRDALPAWLRTVVRRCALDLRRDERRRHARERLVARSSGSAANDTHEQVELMQRVLAAVQSLHEPYRTTVWQRYYEDRSPREIAALQGVPGKTVKTRLWRALARLRERLDREFADRRAWLTLIAPLGAAQKTAVLGVILMSVKTKLALAGLLCAAFALSLSLPNHEPTLAEPEANTTAPSVAAAPGQSRQELAAANAEATERSQVPDAAPGLVVPLTGLKLGLANPIPLGGLVLDLEARPVPGVTITWNDKRLEPTVLTNAEGRFDGTRGPGMGRVGVAGGLFVPVLEPNLFDTDLAHTDLTIVVAPRIRIAGIVVDTAGLPITGAQITVLLGTELRARIPRVLDRCVDAKFWTMTPDDGTFAIDRAPLGPNTSVHIEARGHRDLDLPAAEAQHLTRFVLERIVTGDTLEGTVVDEQDRPISQAVVWLPSWSVVTAPDGTFRIELWKAKDLPPGTLPELTAAASNRLTGKVTALSPEWRSRGAWPVPLRIRLGGVTEWIRGRVLHPDDTPVADVQVSFVPPEPEQIRPTMFDFDNPFQHAFPQAVPAERPVDAAAGEFETARVVPGSYRLRVFDPVSLDLMLTDAIRTGQTDVVLRMLDRGRWPALNGLVVDRRGAPVPGADWIVERDDPLPAATEPMNGGWHNATATGRIEHPPLSRDVHTLCVKAAGMAEWVKFKIADLAHADFRVVVPLGCQARIEIGGAWGNIDTVGLVDLAGARSPVVITHGNVAWGTRDIPIHDGRSQTFTALDDCVELLLFRGGNLVGRMPIALRPGEMNVLRP